MLAPEQPDTEDPQPSTSTAIRELETPRFDETVESHLEDAPSSSHTPSTSRKRLRHSGENEGGDAQEEIAKYITAKEKAVAPNSECDVFGKHLANELRVIKSIGRRKRVQMQILQLVFDAQVEDGAI